MQANYAYSAYMLPSETGTVEEMVSNHDYARFLHYADILRFKMDELEAAGALDPMLSIRCMDALRDAQHSAAFTKVQHYSRMLDQMLETLS